LAELLTSMEKNATLRWLREITWPSVPGLETAPTPEEGYIASVSFETVRGTASEDDAKACQECGQPVFLADPHVSATVWMYSGTRSGPKMKRPVFCDRECWTNWATSSRSK
jgi:hypothetical protein